MIVSTVGSPSRSELDLPSGTECYLGVKERRQDTAQRINIKKVTRALRGVEVLQSQDQRRTSGGFCPASGDWLITLL